MARWQLWVALMIGGACKRAAPATPAGPCETAAACVALAEAQLRSPSPAEAIVVQSLGRACELRSGDACLRLSHYLALHGAETGPVNALLDRACEVGHQGACLAVADALLAGERGRKRDVARGLALMEKACRNGERAACGQLGELRHGADAAAARRATSR
jgi:TPR repeat protein